MAKINTMKYFHHARVLLDFFLKTPGFWNWHSYHSDNSFTTSQTKIYCMPLHFSDIAESPATHLRGITVVYITGIYLMKYFKQVSNKLIWFHIVIVESIILKSINGFHLL